VCVLWKINNFFYVIDNATRHTNAWKTVLVFRAHVKVKR